MYKRFLLDPSFVDRYNKQIHYSERGHIYIFHNKHVISNEDIYKYKIILFH